MIYLKDTYYFSILCFFNFYLKINETLYVYVRRKKKKRKEKVEKKNWNRAVFVFDENWIPRGERDRCRSTAATTTTTTIGDDARSIFTEPRSLTERDTGSKHQERASLVSGTKMDRREEEERKEDGEKEEGGRGGKEEKRRGDYRNSSFLFRNLVTRKNADRGYDDEIPPSRGNLLRNTCLGVERGSWP